MHMSLVIQSKPGRWPSVDLNHAVGVQLLPHEFASVSLYSAFDGMQPPFEQKIRFVQFLRILFESSLFQWSTAW